VVRVTERIRSRSPHEPRPAASIANVAILARDAALGLAPRIAPEARPNLAPARPIGRHRVDIDHTRVGTDEAQERIGASFDLLLRMAELGATDRQRIAFDEDQFSYGSLYRLAARGLFGPRARKVLRYAELKKMMELVGLGGEFEAMVNRLPRPLLRRLQTRGLPPSELFEARAREVGAWRMSPKPMTLAELRQELALSGAHDFEAIYGRLRPNELEELNAGRMAAREVSRLVDQKRLEDVDVLIIGAGAAGINAANELLDSGARVAILEAKDYVGGRAHSESSTLGVPFDHGGAWIHLSKKNPLVSVVEGLGFTTIPTPKFQKAFIGGDPVEAAHLLHDRFEEMEQRLDHVIEEQPSAKVSVLPPPKNRLDTLALGLMGPLEVAVELDQIKGEEYRKIVSEREDRMVEGGLGNIVRAFAHGVPVALETPVDLVRWGRDGVEVRSGNRTFRAKMLLNTASPVALRKHVRFEPELPEWKTKAIAGFQMASFEKIALEFEPGTLAKVAPFERACGFDESGHPIELLLKPYGADIAVVLVGANWARRIVEQGDQEAIEYALHEVARRYGSELKAAFRGAARTKWSNDPAFEGTWALKTPAASPSTRDDYAKPIDDTLFFGGEACAGEWAVTVNGAFANGADVGVKIREALGRERRRAVGAPGE
jgi:monoamine oxidase